MFGNSLRQLLKPLGLTVNRTWPFLSRLPRRHVTSARVFRELSPDLKEIDSWQIADPAPPTCELYRIWKQIPHGHKWWHYFDVYSELLAPFRQHPIRFLEIGIYHGASLELWRSALHPESVIVGLDIDPDCRRFDDPARRIHCRIGDQSDPEFLRQVVAEFGEFDLILDDGSHQCSRMIASFNTLFPRGLKPRGIYIVEDTHSNYWMSHRDQTYSFLDFAKDLVDVMHQHYLQAPGEQYFRLAHPDRRQSFQVPRLTRDLAEIRFLDSMVVFTRRQDRPVPVSEHL